MKTNQRQVNAIIKESIDKIIGESLKNQQSLVDAMDLLVDAYDELQSIAKRDKGLALDLATSLNAIRNAIRIIRVNC